MRSATAFMSLSCGIVSNDTIDHGWMQKFLEHRIGDKRMVRLLMKWLHAGVMEDGELREEQLGVP